MRRRRGFILLLAAVSLVVLMGAAGLAIDGARLYAIRNEARAHADLAAVAAAQELDGTRAGVDRARRIAATLPGRWSMGTEPFPAPKVEFYESTSATGARPADGRWTNEPGEPVAVRRVRVTVETGAVPLFLIAAVTASRETKVAAAAVAEIQGEFGPEAPIDDLPLGLGQSEHKAGDRVALTPILIEGDRVKITPGLAADADAALKASAGRKAIVTVFGPPQEPRVRGRAVVTLVDGRKGVYEGLSGKRAARLVE